MQCPGESRALPPEPTGCWKTLHDPIASSPLILCSCQGDPGLAYKDWWAQVARNGVPGTLQTQQIPWAWWLVPWRCPSGALSPWHCISGRDARPEPLSQPGTGPGDTLPCPWNGSRDSQHRPVTPPNAGLGQDAAPSSAPVLHGGRKTIQMEMLCC